MSSLFLCPCLDFADSFYYYYYYNVNEHSTTLSYFLVFVLLLPNRVSFHSSLHFLSHILRFLLSARLLS